MGATIEAAIKPFEIATHNGIITIRSHRTGEHRTVRIWTQSKDSKFKPGARLIGLLSGSDNTTHYRNFAEIRVDGSVHLWMKYQESEIYQWLCKALSNPERFMDKVDFMFEGCCRRCNRTLTTPESVELGIGPTCSGRE